MRILVGFQRSSYCCHRLCQVLAPLELHAQQLSKMKGPESGYGARLDLIRQSAVSISRYY